MTDEKLRILKMLENGAINATEATELLNAIQDDTALIPETETKSFGDSESKKKRAKWMKVEVLNKATNQKTVNLRLPLWLLRFRKKGQSPFNFQMSNGTRFDFEEEEFMGMINNAEPGVIVDVNDEDEGEHVLISLE